MVNGKACIRAKWPIRPALISGFCSTKRLRVFLLLPPGWDASPSKGYPPWSENLKSVQVWVREKSRIIVHLRIAVVRMLRKTFIAMWHRRVPKIILDKTSYRISVLCEPWHLELYVWSTRVQCWPDSESGRETILASDSSSEYPRSEASQLVFRGW